MILQHLLVEFARGVGVAGLLFEHRKVEGGVHRIRFKLQRLFEMIDDGGPFLYLSPTNPENHAFLLTRKPPEGCK